MDPYLRMEETLLELKGLRAEAFKNMLEEIDSEIPLTKRAVSLIRTVKQYISLTENLEKGNSILPLELHQQTIKEFRKYFNSLCPD